MYCFINTYSFFLSNCFQSLVKYIPQRYSSINKQSVFSFNNNHNQFCLVLFSAFCQLVFSGELVQELLLDSVCPSTLDEMFTLLEPWLIQNNANQRSAALETLNIILHCYINNVKFGYEVLSKFLNVMKESTI